MLPQAALRSHGGNQGISRSAAAVFTSVEAMAVMPLRRRWSSSFQRQRGILSGGYLLGRLEACPYRRPVHRPRPRSTPRASPNFPAGARAFRADASVI